MNEKENSLRPLSSKGVKDVRRVAEYLAGTGRTVDRIYHSRKLRAKQTAEILSEVLHPVKEVVESDGLAPMDNPRVWFDRVSGMDEDTMLVGHLPFMGLLLSLYLPRGKRDDMVEFVTAGAACLRRAEEGEWRLEWMVNPGDLE